MNVRQFLFISTLIGSIVDYANAGPFPAGAFGLPYNENQSWTACGSKGWFPYGDPNSHQYHTQYYAAVGKYHIGEDWNGMCGGNSDEGAPLLSIAEGEVVFLDNVGTVSGQGKRLYIRHSFPYAHAKGGLLTFDVAMLHLQGIGLGISWSGSGTGSTIVKGQTVAYLGKTGTTYAHLHWEAQTNLTIPLGTNPYQNPLSKTQALKYLSPSMIVGDRRDVLGYRVPAPGGWYSFTMSGNAPSSTMYVMHNRQRKSLKNAIALGWIPSQGILHEDNGSWYYYNDVDDNFFENGKRYAVRTLISGPVHYIPVPRNKYQEDRGRLDMIHAVENDSRFVSIKTETYEHDLDWNSSWELHRMAFNLSSGGTSWVNQATNKINPLERYTSYYDPDLGQWTSWEVDWNQLY